MTSFCLTLFLLLTVAHSYGYESWLHRVHEYSSPEFTYTSDCSQVKNEDVKDLFDLDVIGEIKGVEVDIIYHSKLDTLLLYHGSSKSKGPQEDFQCFKGRFVRLVDFLDILWGINPNLKIWIDLKNRNLTHIKKASEKLVKIKANERLIIETKSYIGVTLLQSKKLKTSLWLSLSHPEDKTLAGKFRSFKNNLKVTVGQWIKTDYISHDCKKFLRYSVIMKNDMKKLCWNTDRNNPLPAKKLAEITNLEVVLYKADEKVSK